MIDTIRFQAFPVRSLPPLEKRRETADPTTGLYMQTGYLGNMRVRLRPDGELTVCGSLPRFLLGSNVGTMRRVEVEEAVRSLAAAFDVRPEACRVYRLDLAATMPMPRPVPLYLNALGPVPRMQMRRFGDETVAYVNGVRTLQFYDKGKEAGLLGHLLRVEVQYKRRLKHQLRREVTLADLYDPAFFAELGSRWRGEYRRVPKRQRHLLEPTTSERELVRQLAGAGLERLGGAVAVRREVGTWEQDRRCAYRLRSAVSRLEAEGNSRADADLIREMDAAVDEAYRLALRS